MLSNDVLIFNKTFTHSRSALYAQNVAIREMTRCGSGRLWTALLSMFYCSISLQYINFRQHTSHYSITALGKWVELSGKVAIIHNKL